MRVRLADGIVVDFEKDIDETQEVATVSSFPSRSVLLLVQSEKRLGFRVRVLVLTGPMLQRMTTGSY